MDKAQEDTSLFSSWFLLMLYIIKKDYFLADYIVDPLQDRPDVTVIKYKRNKCRGIGKIKHLFIRFIRTFLCNRKGLWTRQFFPGSFLQQLKAIGKDDKVLFWGCENLKELLVLDKEIECREKSVFLWNPVSTICRNAYSKWEYAHYLNKTKMRIYTFDEGDAASCHFSKINQVYRHPSSLLAKKTADGANDVLFIGKDKSRSAFIAQLAQQLQQQGVSFDFYIIKDKHTVPIRQLEPYYHDREMSYEESLARIMHVNCIIEIMQQGQTGMTLRTLEAMFLGKKLITTNPNIAQSPVYHPNNIYILNSGKNKHANFREFLDSEYHCIPESIIKQYDAECWIEQFL